MILLICGILGKKKKFIDTEKSLVVATGRLCVGGGVANG